MYHTELKHGMIVEFVLPDRTYAKTTIIVTPVRKAKNTMLTSRVADIHSVDHRNRNGKN